MPRGDRIGDAYVRVILVGDDKDFRKQLEADGGKMEEVGEKYAKSFSKGYDEQIAKTSRTTNAKLAKEFEGGLGRWRAIGEQTAKIFNDGFQERFKEGLSRDFKIDNATASVVMNRIRKRFSETGELNQLSKDLGRDLTRNVIAGIEEMDRAWRDATRENQNFNKSLKETEEAAQKASGNTHTFFGRLRRDADFIGRAFGRGSRNDFLNFIGALVRGSTLAIGTVFGGIGQLLGKVGQLEAVSKAFGSLATKFPKLASLASSAVGPVGSLVSGVVALAAAFLGLSFAVNVMIAVGGAATALALTVGGALAGGIALLGATLVPVVAGIAGMTIAITSLDDASKKALSDSIRPLTNQFKEMGKELASIALEGLDEDIQKLTNLFESDTFGLFIDNLGLGLKRFREELVKGLPAFGSFVAELNALPKGFTIGDQLADLGTIIRQTFGGLGGLFLSIQPAAHGFLQDLIKITGEFNRFSNDVSKGGGREQLTRFFDGALDGLEAVGRLLRSTAGLFVDLFNAGGNTSGIKLIDDFRRKIEQLRNFVRDNPEAVADFFRRAVAVTERLGGLILAIGRALGQLFTPQNTQTLLGLINLFTFLANAVGFVIRNVDKLLTLLGPLGGALSSVGTIFRLFGGSADDARAKSGAFAAGVQSDAAFLAALPPFSIDLTANDQATAVINGVETTATQYARNPYLALLTAKDKNATATITPVQGLMNNYVNNGPYTASVEVEDKASGPISNIINKMTELVAYVASHSLVGKLLGLSRGGITFGFANGGVTALGQKLETFAAGGFANYRQFIGPNAIAGEAGPEAIVPLSRPLGQVDPAVRALSAIAQGYTTTGDTINNTTFNVTTTTADPTAVAYEVLARATAAAY